MSELIPLSPQTGQVMTDDSILQTIRHNCDISDARDNGIYSICNLVLKLRNLYKWEHHIQPVLNGKKMDSIIPLDVHEIVAYMKKSRDYAPATIRQVIVLVKRLYNWASEMGLYEGLNPIAKVKHPKINNEVTECLTKDEISRLLKTLDKWHNRRVALLIKFDLYTGLRRGELFIRPANKDANYAA